MQSTDINLTGNLETALFDYSLPQDAIAQTPAEPRDHSRLMVIDRKSRKVDHCRFYELDTIVPKTARFIRNNATVLKARLRAQRPSGGAVECLLLRPEDSTAHKWRCLLKPGKKLPVGSSFGIPGQFEATVLEKHPDGECIVAFTIPANSSVIELTNAIGEPPLPPYIRRDGGVENTSDSTRYQTVYADPGKPVAVAAPTAGLHFTKELLERLHKQGNTFYDLTLHVGLGTFKPIESERIADHQMHSEFYEIPPNTLSCIEQQTTESPRIATGTTALRAIEAYSRQGIKSDPAQPFFGNASLFIYPPDHFHCESLITNFHLPRSTLLCLVSAFLTPGSQDGIRWIKELYAEALRKDYRFYSYGDAMLIL